jgi:beta-1,4-mannooligosaccharide/beta-1,4-mannosyl-N-acetylglucosamine phosphorylase
MILSSETHSIFRRHHANPVLSARDVPYPATLVYNAGICKFQGKYVMVFRNDIHDYPNPGTAPIQWNHMTITLGLATSDDGIRWKVAPKPCFVLHTEEILRCYDPRLTVIEGRVYMCFAMDTRHGICGGIAVTDDFDTFQVLHTTVPDNRNMVLFPEKINGTYVRLERPFPVYGRGGKNRFDIWLSRSPNFRYWGDCALLLAVEKVPFANDKIGPAAPPIRTRKGWLTTFHAVDIDETRGKNGWEDRWTKRYTTGLMLLDLHDPSKVIGLCRTPLLQPQAPYETSGGLRNNVIFPGGMILEDSGEIKLYYGAADTVECLATAHVDDLLRLIECAPAMETGR